MSAETPGVASDKKQNAAAPTSKTPPPTTIRIPPFEKGGPGGISGGLGGIPGVPGGIWNLGAIQLLTNHLEIWTTAETEKKSGRGRSGSNGTSVYGIKKLRELILELAVRGKLVPQDPDDEPAGELLKRIQVEKAKLIAEGKIKKSKSPLAPLFQRGESNSATATSSIIPPTIPPFEKGGLGEIPVEEPFELPQGWEWVRFGDFVFSILSGGTPSKNNLEFWNGDIPWASVKDLNVEKFLERTQDYITKEGLESGSKLANKGDLLICTRMGLGKIAIAAIDVAINQDLKALKITSFLNIDYFINFYNTLKITGSGMTVAGIKQDELLGYLVPTPPLPEQHRIVAKVDELMALCDQLENQHINAAEAHEKLVNHLLGTLTQSHSADDFNANWQRIAAHFDTLFTTETSIDVLKQTLLQLAVMGKLVPQDPNDEPASELLKLIQAEKAKLIAEGKIKKDKPLPPILEEEKPFELPQGWEWVRLGSVLEITGGVTLGRKISSADLVELPYLRVANVQRGYLVLDSIKTVEIQYSELSRYQLLRDDLLVTEGGDWDKVGRTAIWNAEIENCLHQNHIFRMRRITEGLSSSWIQMYMNSIAKAYFQASSKQTTNLASINMTQLKNCLLAVPTLREQHRIVTKVDELMALCDQLKFRITQASQLQKNLADGVVEQAIAS